MDGNQLLDYKGVLQYTQYVQLCTKYENSLSKGKRSIIHLEAFIYNILDMIYNKMHNK